MPQCLYITERNGAPVPCGKCMYCRNKRIAGWSARLMNKDKHSDMSLFLTLTYDTDHLIFCERGRPTLHPSHLTSYWKLIRKNLKKGEKIAYYACGEYGSNKQRPHYHAIVFIQTKRYPIELLKLFENQWKHGSIYCGNVTGESVAYTLKYISKAGSVPAYSGDKRVREFQRSSKGLGLEYIAKTKGWHHDDLLNRAYIPLPGGNRAPMPRYYKDKIFTTEQKLQIGTHMQETQPSREHTTTQELRKVSVRKINGKNHSR